MADLGYRLPWPTRAVAIRAIFDYVEGFSNPRRIQSTVGNLSPGAYERLRSLVAQSA